MKIQNGNNSNSCRYRIAHPAVNGPNNVTGSRARELIVSGKGIQVVEANGWNYFRDQLVRIPYAEIFAHQMQEIDALEAKVSSSLPKEEIIQANTEAEKLAYEIAKSFENQVSGLSEQEIVEQGYIIAHVAEVNKISLLGLQAESGSYPCTRIYIKVRTGNAPEAFKALVKHLIEHEKDVASRIHLSLFLKIFDFSTIRSDAIIAYIFKDGRELDTLQRLCNAISTVKAARGDLWGLTPADLVESKFLTIVYFLVPLDDNSAIAELESVDNTSYHRLGWRCFHEITENKFLHGGIEIDLEKVHEFLKIWTPNNPGRFETPYLSVRRKFMPALIF